MIFFFNDTATTEIYTLSLHDALPISEEAEGPSARSRGRGSASWTSSGGSGRTPGTGSSGSWSGITVTGSATTSSAASRSEEHTSELQSRQYFVCRLLLEKK